MRTFSKDDLLDAVADLSTMKFFPSDPGARVSICRSLAKMMPHYEALRWTIDRLVAMPIPWPGIGELRRLLCTKYGPADGLTAASSLPGCGAPESDETPDPPFTPAARTVTEAAFDYPRYLASREWAQRKEAVRARSGGICERCKTAPMKSVHHVTYENIGNEPLEDLQGVCNPCHEFLSAKSDVDPTVEEPEKKNKTGPSQRKPDRLLRQDEPTPGVEFRPYRVFERFGIIPDQLVQSALLTPREKLCWVAISRYMGGPVGTAFPSYDTLARAVGVSRRQAIRLVKGLERKEFLKVISRWRENRNEQTSNEYRLLWHEALSNATGRLTAPPKSA